MLIKQPLSFFPEKVDYGQLMGCLTDQINYLMLKALFIELISKADFKFSVPFLFLLSTLFIQESHQT